MPETKLLFIAGFDHNGSTILHNVLSQFEGFAGVGEVHHIARRFSDDLACGCGRPFSQCPFWERVFESQFGGRQNFDTQLMGELEERRLRAGRLRHALNLREHYRPHLEQLQRLYAGIAEVSGARVIIDNSKQPLYAGMLRLLPFEHFCIHLVRDPRGHAYSILRRRAAGRGSSWRFSTPGIGLRLLYSDAALSGMRRQYGGRWMRLRYEDFMAEPQAWLGRILDFLREARPARSQDFMAPGAVVLKPTHTCGGNAKRLVSGLIPLVLDNEWQRHLPAADRSLIESLCLPLMLKYGYFAREASGA